MTDKKEIRRANLKRLYDSHGGLRPFCKRYALNESYISRIASGKAHRTDAGDMIDEPFTEKAARKIEKQAKLPAGWLDHAGDGEARAVAPAIDAALLAKVVEVARPIKDELRLDDARFADLIHVAYTDALERGNVVDPSFVRRAALALPKSLV